MSDFFPVSIVVRFKKACVTPWAQDVWPVPAALPDVRLALPDLESFARTCLCGLGCKPRAFSWSLWDGGSQIDSSTPPSPPPLFVSHPAAEPTICHLFELYVGGVVHQAYPCWWHHPDAGKGPPIGLCPPNMFLSPTGHYPVVHAPSMHPSVDHSIHHWPVILSICNTYLLTSPRHPYAGRFLPYMACSYSDHHPARHLLPRGPYTTHIPPHPCHGVGPP